MERGTRHLQRRRSYREEHSALLRDARAQCHLARAREFDQAGSTVERDQQIIEARLWDHRTDGLNAYATQIADVIDEQGQHLRSKEDWQGAYDAFSLAMKLDPTRSWTRRQAEEMRDKRLNITPPYKKKKKKKSAVRPALQKTDRPNIKKARSGSKKTNLKLKKSDANLPIKVPPQIKKSTEALDETQSSGVQPNNDESQNP